jgi:hypothetical protein
MSEQSGKPAGGAPPFSAQEAMAFMQKMWNPFAMPMPGSSAGAVTPTDSPPDAASGGSQGQPVAASAAPVALSGMMGGVMPGMLPFPNPAAMFAALDPVEVERKIGELRVIEGWLTMSLNLMQMSIKTLELQHASLEALQAAHAPPKTAKRESKSKKS